MNLLNLKRQLLPMIGYRGIFDCDCACADYKPTADASVETAKIMGQLGQDQLAESRRQYDLNQSVMNPIINSQAKNMDLAYSQGSANYERLKDAGFGLQDQMTRIANGETTESQRAQMDKAASEAAADVSSAVSSQRDQSSRQMSRMGVNPSSGRAAATQNQLALGAASASAGAQNAARTQAGDKYYAKIGDAYNTYAGLGSQAPTFYNSGTNSGQAASSSQLGLSNALMSGLAQGTSTIQGGLSAQISGLLGAANGEQAGFANMGNLNGLGQMVSTGLGAYAGYKSDRRLKKDLVEVGVDEGTGLTIYDFTYRNDDSGKRYRGVMADEVVNVMPEAVVYDEDGFASVIYDLLGIEFKEVSA